MYILTDSHTGVVFNNGQQFSRRADIIGALKPTIPLSEAQEDIYSDLEEHEQLSFLLALGHWNTEKVDEQLSSASINSSAS